MNKKKVLAAALIASLCFTNMAWGDVADAGLEGADFAQNQNVATVSDADPVLTEPETQADIEDDRELEFDIATEANADVELEEEAADEPGLSLFAAAQEYPFTLQLETEGEKYTNSYLYLTVSKNTELASDVYYHVMMKKPGEDSAEVVSSYRFSQSDTTRQISVNSSHVQEVGTYKLWLVRQNAGDRLSGDIEINIKQKYIGYRATITLPADGVERTFHISDFYGNMSDGEQLPETITLGDLSAEAREHFAVLPVVNGMTIRFTLKKSEADFQVQIPVTMSHPVYGYGDDETLRLQAKGAHTVPTRTEDEIKAYLRSHPFSLTAADQWQITPNINTETAGKLTAASVKNALNSLNFVRYVAGLNEVTNNEEQEEYAQAGTTLLAKVGKLTHYPQKPAGVSDAFYEKGKTGTSSSNIAYGYGNLANTVISGWMDDGDSGNIDRVGHRMWCLDPRMRSTGFGHSGIYTAMWSFDSYQNDAEYPYSYIPWPAQLKPVE